MVGTLGYVLIEDYNLIDAFFQTGYTLTTTGFGSLNEHNFSVFGKIFTVLLIFFGFFIFTFSIGIVLDVINKGIFARLYKEKNMLHNIARLKNHYVICYHNEYTIELADSFKKARISFVVIDPMQDFDTIAQTHGYAYFINDEPHSESALLKAHLEGAKGVITLSKNISDNIAQIASVRLFEKDFSKHSYYIISSAKNSADINRLKKIGANSVISPTKLLTQRMRALALKPNMENLLEHFVYAKDAKISIEEIYVPNESWLILKKLKEAHLRDVFRVAVIGISQKDGTFIDMPMADCIITSGCRMLLVGDSKCICKAETIITSPKKPKELQ